MAQGNFDVVVAGVRDLTARVREYLLRSVDGSPLPDRLSKRTAVYATAGRIANDGTLAISVSGTAPGGAPAAGQGQKRVAAGIQHFF